MTGATTENTGHDPTMPTAGVINKKKTQGDDELDTELVIAARMGSVLIKHTVLKADHFPSCHNTKLTPILDGAPNFRKVDGLPVYGVAIPTVTGLRQVMEAMGARKGQRRVYWQNLREEPLIFINGQPFVVRESDQPFSNLEYTGIDRQRVEDMEVRLKADILHEAAHFNNHILVMHENEDLSLYDHWEPVTPEDVQTPQEVYDELKADGYDVDYIRIPITDEKAPKDDDFQVLIDRLWDIPPDAGAIFNCQMGRGRTTTGMIIASLLHLRKIEAFPLKKTVGRLPVNNNAVVPEWFKSATLPFITAKGGAPPVEGALESRLKAGHYGVVRSLLRALERGPEAKAVLDAVTDSCGAMQNLREGILSYRTRFLKEARERQRNVLLSVCLEYLERYYMLIAFCGYLSSAAFDPGSSQHMTFPQWMAARAELRSILIRLLRRNSMAALELHQRGGGGEPATSPSAGGAGGSGGGGADMDTKEAPERDVVATRTGAVLGAYCILKEDNFPGMQSNKIAQPIEGAPNFRGIPGLPVYGVGMPTVEGIIGVLRAVAGGNAAAGKRLAALWINMREEPVVYINGRPFVLREEVRPLKNMMEYEGIDAARLEGMEDRLKKDVLAEAIRHGGRILVAHESFEYGHYGELYDNWEEIDHPDAVQTPAEVYASLMEQGFAVKYCRLPVTDGSAPMLADFDQLVQVLLETGLEYPVIFNCQMGIGRSTTGTVIASLVHVYRTGQMETARTAPDSLQDRDYLRHAMVSGLSPRSDQDEDEPNDSFLRDPDGDEEGDDRPKKVWDLSPAEQEEQRSLAAGGYVGVRRVVRLLQAGDQAKQTVDSMVDAASDLINLRVAIMKYRKPRSSYKFLRPELQQRATAFKKGSAYLERYVLLVAFAYWLENIGPDASNFSSWMSSRPDLISAIEAVRANPGVALSPLPLPGPPILLDAEGDGPPSGVTRDQKKVMSRRKGRLLTRRTILKSYLFHSPQTQQDFDEEQPVLEDVPDIKRVLQEMPIYAVGSLTMDGFRSLLKYLDAQAGGKATVCITDVREELVVYVNGTPYTRRELEMPAAALHHAGSHAAQLEEQETLMMEDVQDEVAGWGGRILLHKEVNEAVPPGLTSVLSLRTRDLSQPGTAGGAQTASLGGGGSHTTSNGKHPNGDTHQQADDEDDKLQFEEEEEEPQASPSPDVPKAARTASAIQAQKDRDDVTAVVDQNPGAKVAAFWEQVDMDDPTTILTPRQLIERLRDIEGFQIQYRRIPLSRERTPVAGDLQQLHMQVLDRQEERFSAPRRTETVHVVLSRTATGSSSRFVGAALTCFYIRPPRASLTGAPILLSPPRPGSARTSDSQVIPRPSSASGSPIAGNLLAGFSSMPAPAVFAAGSPPALGMAQRGSLGGSPQFSYGALMLSKRTSEGRGTAAGLPVLMKSLDLGSGEYRGIMSLCRVLPAGLDAKRMVDMSIDLVRPIGNILADIARCKEAASKPLPAAALPSTPSREEIESLIGANLALDAARQLGTHYLKRYFLLITYRCFLEQCGNRSPGYAAWVESQKELGHLLSHLSLDR